MTVAHDRCARQRQRSLCADPHKPPVAPSRASERGVMGHSLVSVSGPKCLLSFLSTLVALLAALSGLLALLPRRWFLTLLLLSILRVIALLLLRLLQFLFFLPVHWLSSVLPVVTITLHCTTRFRRLSRPASHMNRKCGTLRWLFPTGPFRGAPATLGSSLRSRRSKARCPADPVPKLAYWFSAVDNSAMMPRRSSRPGTSCRPPHLSKEYRIVREPLSDSCI